ncbi:acyl-CoA N-acyltransferase [Macrolepiota fuliginosa MF-IS2]|uniref:N-alpha-acetyltransferase 60 n=1 Tax=Macrolepiota fuliginosa MF-IS2 TaxID=1400762 RepID=A0A9P6CA84_9AGAR|nr:acyl-CoA N-acyltransferase [Macrolepiota fuliginosa MF-IS2]
MPSAAHSDILIRPLTSSDVPDTRSLHSLVLPVQYPPAFFTQLLCLSSRACLIAVRRSQPNIPIAFISAALHKSSLLPLPGGLSASKALNSPRPRIEILTLGVLPAFQQHGLARRLIRAIVDKLCGPLTAGILVHANVATTNTPALKFYERIGMRISSEIIPNLYRTCPYGERDAYLVSGRLDI